jgi:cytochrome P460
MDNSIGARSISRRVVVAKRLRPLRWVLLAVGLAGCQPLPAPAVVQPAEFATWPRVTPKPVPVTYEQSRVCVVTLQPYIAREEEEKARGPHARHATMVRVSPDGIEAYLEGRPLPTGAVVVKEKYSSNRADLGPLRAYGVMIKREPGFAPRGGDWEYAYVTLDEEPRVARGHLRNCAGCHASARGRDYLFRAYGTTGR